jgi:hypothetical protein
MGKLRTDCAYCGKPYTAEEMEARKKAKADNALNSRAKAKANGKSVCRKRIVSTAKAKALVEVGHSVAYIAGLYNVSESSIYRALAIREGKG